jgi:hypothetical protein
MRLNKKKLETEGKVTEATEQPSSEAESFIRAY